MTTDSIKAVDLFCGAGGTSTGLAHACRHLDRRLDLLAINHWDLAIATHQENHPDVRHLCESLDNVDPRKVVDRLDLLVASPECTHHSRARGGRPVQDQSRASAWHVVRWAEALLPKWILVENVQEFRSWGPIGSDNKPLKSRKGETYHAFLEAVRSLGYTVEDRILNAANYGDPTSRERLFVLARRGRHRSLPWPVPTHSSAGTDLLNTTNPWRTAREIIDWSLPGNSIFNRKRPLAPATLKRIEAGLRKFGGRNAEPFLVILRNNQDARSVDRPRPTITTSGAHFALVEPFLVRYHGNHQGKEDGHRRVHGVDGPIPTLDTSNRYGLCEPFLLPHRAFREGHVDSIDEPLRTITATNGGGAIVEPFLVPFFGERDGQDPRVHSVDDPLPTVTSHGAGGLVQPFLVKYNRTGKSQSIDQPLGTVTIRDRFALVEPHQLDILFRMLQPRELASAMGFDRDYTFTGNKGDQVRQIGNAVPVNLAKALCETIILN